MKFNLSVCAVLIAALTPISAQLATSHTPQQYPSFESDVPLQAVGKPVARVNGAELTDRDLLNTMYAMFPWARQHNGSVPKSMEKDIRAGAMKMMIFEELVYQEATRRKMTVPETKLRKAEAAYEGRFDNPRQYLAYVQASYGGSQALLRSKIRRSLLIDQFLQAEVDQKATISDAAIKDYYLKNLKQFDINESYSFQSISILPPNNATADQLKEARKRADNVIKLAKASKTYMEFGLLAEKYSDDDYRVVLGDHKAVERSKLPPNVTQILLAMKPEDVSDLIQLGNDYTILRLNKHIPAGHAKFEDVKESLRKNLKQGKLEQLRSALDKKLHENAKIQVL